MRTVIGILFLLLSVSPVNALHLEGSLSPERMTLGSTARLAITVQDYGKSSPAPRIPDVDGLSIRSAGTSRQVQFVNGRMSSSLTLTYLIYPQKTGHFEIGPIEVKVDGQEERVGPFGLDVLSASDSHPQSPSPKQETLKDHLFVEGTLSKTRTFVQEPLIYTFSFWSRVSSPIQLTEQPSLSWPSFDGFWSEENTHTETKRLERNGKLYEVTFLTRLLFPLSAGKHTLGPSSLQVQVKNVQARRRRTWGMDPFNDPFFQDFFDRGEPLVLHTDPLEIEVLEPPREGRPNDFSGAVGIDIRYEASLDRTEVDASEAVTLRAVLRGRFNPKALQLPLLEPPEGLKAYDPEIETGLVQRQGNGFQGKCVAEWILIPQSTGSFIVQIPSFVYFDTGQQSYVRTDAPSLQLRVTGSVQDQQETLIVSRGSEVLAKDIIHIQMEIGSWRRGVRTFPGTPSYWCLHGGLLLVWVLLGGLKALYMRRNADPVGRRRKEALKRAVQSIRRQSKVKGGEGEDKAMAAIHRAMEDYLRDKSNGECGHTAIEMANWLKERGVLDERIERYGSLFERLEGGRYAGGARRMSSLDALRSEAISALKQLEGDLR